MHSNSVRNEINLATHKDLNKYIYISKSEKDIIDFSFAPNGTRFLEDIAGFENALGPRFLYLCTSDPHFAHATTKSWLSRPESTIEIVWNHTINSDFGYAMLELLDEVGHIDFRRAPNRAHLALSNHPYRFEKLPTNEVRNLISNLVNETVDENVAMPPETFKQLTWRYKYLLDQIDGLSNRAKVSEEALHRSREINKTLSSDIEELKKKIEFYDGIENKLDELAAKYRALSESRFGAWTLKYWKLKNGK